MLMVHLFYREILSNGRVLMTLAISTLSGFIMASFDTTLPLHVQRSLAGNCPFLG